MFAARSFFGSIHVGTMPTSQIAYTTPGTYTFIVPDGVTSISALVIGGGGGGGGNTNIESQSGTGGGGGK